MAFAGLVAAAIVALFTSQSPTVSPVRVGLLIGEPICATVGFTLSERFIMQADIGPSTSSRQSAIAAVDLVYTLPEVFGGDLSRDHFVPWFGLGLRLSMGKDETPNRFGPRIPFGISFFAAENSIELFASIAPGLSLAPDVWSSLDGGLGVRVAF